MEDSKNPAEILEMDKLSRILDDFYIASGLSNAILDLDGKVLHMSGWRRICDQYHRKNPISQQRCLQSDTIMANQLEKMEKYSMYRCRNGMVDVATPIVVGDEHVANLFIGQFFLEEPNREFFIKQAQELGFDQEDYLQALDECRVYDREKIEKYLDFLSGLTTMIGDSALNLNQMNLYADSLNRAQKYNRSLLEASLDAFVTISPDGYITDVNQATERITGLSQEELIGMDFSDFFADKIKARLGLKYVFDDGQLVDYELDMKHISSITTTVLFNASLYRDENGKIIGVFAAARDVTNLRKAEERIRERTAQLESANKELESLTYTVSHDLKAPVRHITGYISLLNSKYKQLLPETGQRYLDNVAVAAANMGELIDGLLKFSRSGRVDMNRSMLNMNGIVENLTNPIMEHDTQHRIVWDIKPLPCVFADYEMIQSVWNNLIENAVKFTGKEEVPQIFIGSLEAEDEIIFYVKDNGTGFDMKYVAKLFNVFQRLHDREEFEGTGIGLATVHRMIARHGGRTWAEGEIGVGATLYFSLPIRMEGDNRGIKDNTVR